MTSDNIITHFLCFPISLEVTSCYIHKCRQLSLCGLGNVSVGHKPPDIFSIFKICMWGHLSLKHNYGLTYVLQQKSKGWKVQVPLLKVFSNKFRSLLRHYHVPSSKGVFIIATLAKIKVSKGFLSKDKVGQMSTPAIPLQGKCPCMKANVWEGFCPYIRLCM